MIREFDSVAFAMRDGEISTPMKTQYGWHIIKHLGYREENGQTEAHVAHILVKADPSAQTLDAAWQHGNDAHPGRGDGICRSGQGEELEVHTTPPA